jgi:DNA-binding transcriptional LysR family regulator
VNLVLARNRCLNKALQNWGIEPSQLDVVLNLNSSEMVRAVVESGVGAAAIPESIVKKELQLETLHAIKIIDSLRGSRKRLEIVQPIWKLKHRQRFQTQVVIAFENLLREDDAQVA